MVGLLVKSMYGIKVIFGITNRFGVQSLLLCTVIFSSCIGKSSNTCKWEKQNYRESWDYEVASTYRYRKMKATYVLQTTTGKRIFFRPIQSIVSLAEPGDRIVKKKNSEFAYLIDEDGDTIRCKIFSETCDSLVFGG